MVFEWHVQHSVVASCDGEDCPAGVSPSRLKQICLFSVHVSAIGTLLSFSELLLTIDQADEPARLQLIERPRATLTSNSLPPQLRG